MAKKSKKRLTEYSRVGDYKGEVEIKGERGEEKGCWSNGGEEMRKTIK